MDQFLKHTDYWKLPSMEQIIWILLSKKLKVLFENWPNQNLTFILSTWGFVEKKKVQREIIYIWYISQKVTINNSQFMSKNYSIRKWTKKLKRPITEDDIQMAYRHMKWCSKSLAKKDCKLRPQWDITTLGW